MYRAEMYSVLHNKRRTVKMAMRQINTLSNRERLAGAGTEKKDNLAL